MSHETHAAPPDAGGHQGTHTRPADVETSTPRGSDHAPPLARDGRRAGAGGRGAGSFVVFGLVLLGLVGFFMYVYGPQ